MTRPQLVSLCALTMACAQGVVSILGGQYVLWSKTRLYAGVRAGTYRFGIECLGPIGSRIPVVACPANVFCAWGFTELSN